MRKTYLVLCISVLLLFVSSSVAMAQGFSADLVSKAGDQVFTGKIYVAKDKMRMDTDMSISITRLDRRVIWILMPQEKMYMEQQLTPQSIIPGKDTMTDEVQTTLLGTETVNGYAANKYRVVIKGKNNSSSHLQWLTVDAGFPVRMAAEDGSWSQDYKNLVMSEPDDAVFEIPAGYKKFSMPF